MVYLLLGEGFEETEAVAPVDILRRGGVKLKTAGVDSMHIRGGHGITVQADMTVSEIEPEASDCFIVPGGLGGVESCESSAEVSELLKKASELGAAICAICAGPRVLARLGLITGRKITCYPGMESQMTGAIADTRLSTSVDERIITGRAPGSAMDFGFEILRAIKGEKIAAQVASDMHYVLNK